MCDEKKIVGFTNEPRKEENDLVIDLNFGDETKAEDNENIVIVENKDESIEAEVKSEVEVDEENSWNSETENQVEISRSATDNPDSESVIEKQVGSCRNYTLTPEARAPPIPLRMSIGPSPLRLSKIPVPQERPQRLSDELTTSHVVKLKPNTPSRLKLTGQYLKIGIPSSDKVYEDRLDKYLEMKDARRVAKYLKREEKSRNPLRRLGQSFRQNSTLFLKEPESYTQAISSSEKENCLQAMQDELQSWIDTNAWTLVECPKEKL